MKAPRSSLACTLLCGWLVGCGLGSEDPTPTPTPSPTPTPAPSPTPAPNPTKLTAPTIDSATPKEVCGKEVGIRGQATPGVAVFAFGGAATSGVATDAHPATGAFCLPLTLVAGKANAIEVRAQDPILGISEAATLSVLQKSCTPEEELGGAGGTVEEPAKSKNVAIGATGKSKDSPELGNLGFLTDGKSSTVATWKGGSVWCNWCDYDGWVTIKLDRLYEVEKIVVRWRDSKGNGTAFGKEYKVLVSPMSDPGDPNIKNGYWEEMGSTSSGDGGVDSYDLSSKKPIMQHVALWLQQDNYPWTSEFIGEEEFAIAELEVWDAPKKNGPPPPPASVCQ